MLLDFSQAFLFIIHGVVFVAITLLVGWLIRPDRPNAEKLLTYECGEDPVSSAQIPFNNRFYVVALMFLIFEVEVILLFPWAMVMSDFGWYGFWAMLIFVGLIFIGFAYEYGKGALEWEKPEPQIPKYVEGEGVIMNLGIKPVEEPSKSTDRA